ncbi:MAG TPA: integration host factor subunit beta [Pyrinomonadaceae bacterium]|nr:integration host factor subunit beta [Pyrinomonadaceae bacterium]
MEMTKAELVEDVARAAELTKKDAERLVEIVFESIIDTLNQGEKIELRGFGSFRVRERGARRGRNPKTGDPVNIPAKRVPYFKPGKELKELINEEASSSTSASPESKAGTDEQGSLSSTDSSSALPDDFRE